MKKFFIEKEKKFFSYFITRDNKNKSDILNLYNF